MEWYEQNVPREVRAETDSPRQCFPSQRTGSNKRENDAELMLQPGTKQTWHFLRGERWKGWSLMKE